MTKQQHTAFTAPHYAASTVGNDILQRGGTAIEAMVAAAASIAVEYPHMNGLGGDGFWLISEPGKAPVAIDACGTAAGLADSNFYQGLDAIPSRGGKAALTMAGAVAGWQKALEISANWQSPMPLQDLLATAISQANWGIEVTQSMSDASFKTFDDLAGDEHFSQFLIKGKALKKGKIVNITSVVGHTGNLGQANYTASKAGIVAMSKSLAIEYAKKNINVNCISPGFIKTAMTDKLDEKFKELIISKIPSARLGEPEDIANAVLFLASDQSNYINGETIHVNGGMYMA